MNRGPEVVSEWPPPDLRTCVGMRYHSFIVSGSPWTTLSRGVTKDEPKSRWVGSLTAWSGFHNWQSAGQVPDSYGRIPWNVPLLKVYVRRAHGYSFLRFPDRHILTGRYHYGRERAKTCQYIHLVSCVAMFCEVAPAWGIPFREGKPWLPPVSLSIHCAN